MSEQPFPEQKPEEFLALQKRFLILYITFAIILLLLIVIVFSKLVCVSNIFIIIFLALLIISLIILVIFDSKYRKFLTILFSLDIKYRKYGAIKIIKLFRILSHVFLMINLFVVVPLLVGLPGICSSGTGEKARDAAIKSDISQLKTALILYADDNNDRYPSNTKISVPESISNLSDLLVPEYLSKINVCPTQGCVYYYLACNQNTDFVLYTDLESKKGLKFFVDSQSGSGEVENPVCPSR